MSERVDCFEPSNWRTSLVGDRRGGEGRGGEDGIEHAVIMDWV